MQKIVIILGIITAVLVDEGRAIDCHQCQAIVSDTCLDPYDPVENEGNLGGCDDDNVCTKWTTVHELRDSGYIDGWVRKTVVVTRSCEPSNGMPDGCTKVQGAGGFYMKCRCSSSGCNSGASVLPDMFVVLTLGMMSLWLYARRV